MKRTLVKDILLFLTLFVTTVGVVSKIFSSVDSNARMWLLLNPFLIFLEISSVLLINATTAILVRATNDETKISLHFSKKRIYFFLFCTFLSFFFNITFYCHPIFNTNILIFSSLVFLSIVCTAMIQLYIILTLYFEAIDKQLLASLEPFSLSHSIFNLLVIFLSSTVLYGISYQLVRETNVEDYILFFTSFFTTFPLLLLYDRFFLAMSKASRFEKQDKQYIRETMLCKEHYLRMSKIEKVLFYSYRECPIPSCGRKHLITGVETFIGVIGNDGYFEKQEDKILILSLWDVKTKRSRSAEIDRLEVQYTEEFLEEDYNQAIQSVVSKFHNSIAEDKRKKVQVKIESKVRLSEASKRLLQDTFGDCIIESVNTL